MHNIFNLLRARAKISGSGRPEIIAKFEALGKPEAPRHGFPLIK